MRTRFTWIVAILALVAIGFLMACSTKYSSSNNGLVVVPSYGSLVMQSFSLDLGNGHISQINNVDGPPTPGLPGGVILDPAGAYAYVATTVTCTPQNLPANTSLSAVQGAIVTYQIASDGKLAAGSTQYLKGNPAYPGTFPTCGLDDATNPNAGNLPTAMAIDSSGKFLFVATSPETATYTINTNTSTPTSTVATLDSVGVAVYAIGSNAGLTEIADSPFSLPLQTGGQTPRPSALAVTPTVFPPLYSPCSLHTPPTTENLYVADSVNNVLLNYLVDMSTGLLTPVPYSATAGGISTGNVPSGVAVDPCNRFVYVSNNTSNTVSAFTICSVVSQSCPLPDFSLQPVAGSPFAVSPGDGPWPLAVDPYGNFLYVVDNGSSQISGFRISSSSGSLTSVGTWATNTVPSSTYPNSIAIRSDEAWMFVANYTSSTVTQYAITPATGGLTLQQSFATLNNPTGVAVK